MAAPISHVKLSKTEKRIHQKQAKARRILLKHEGIQTVETATKILCVSNAGLDNGVTQEEVRGVFTTYGVITEVIMLPGKPYCFVVFSQVSDCDNACRGVNGFLFRKGSDSSQDVYFYSSFVNQVPASIAPSKELPPGLILLPDFISKEYEQRLLEEIKWEGTQDETQKCLKHRKVKHYGFEFKYGINNVDPNEPLAEGIPESCKDMLTRVLETGIVNHLPDQLTVNQYEPGQGIPPHVDTPSAFEDGLMSLSLGSQVVMDFRHPDGHHLSVFLPTRSLLVMTGESRYIWSHGITPRKSDIITTPDDGLTLINRGTRTSFTFRKLTPLAGLNVKQDETPNPSMPENEDAAVRLEHEHVHQVYEDIADHFSGTRHKAWPQIAEFITPLPLGTLLADIGCGNGKYLGINQEIYKIGSDRSYNLALICAQRSFPVFVADILSIPLRSNSFDACLCIAVIHHLSTVARRCAAVKELLRILRPGGRLLIYVWAMEQERQKVKSKYLKSKQNASEDCSEVQMLVSEKTTLNTKNKDKQTLNTPLLDESCTRTKSGNVENADIDDVSSRGSLKPISGDDTKLHSSTEEKCAHSESDQSHHVSSVKKLAVHVNRTTFREQDVLVPWQKKGTKDTESEPTKSTTFHRFYHVFREGELEELCAMAGDSHIVKQYYDQGNWCVVLQKS